MPKSDHDLLIRIDQRTQNIEQELSEIKNNYVTQEEYQALLNEIKEIKENYVRKESFAPIKQGFYGLIALIVSTVVLALIGLVLMR